jgi:hypothetical protein
MRQKGADIRMVVPASIGLFFLSQTDQVDRKL